MTERVRPATSTSRATPVPHPERVDAATPTSATPEPRGHLGTARVARPGSDVVSRARTGDVVVLDQSDLDPATARALIGAGVAAVVNAAPMTSGRFPGAGPALLAEAGVILVDRLGADALALVPDGRPVRVVDGTVQVGAVTIARGRQVDADELRTAAARARRSLVAHLDTFAASTSDVLHREQDLILDGVGLPALATAVAGRAVVVVARSGDHAAELQAVRRFIRDQEPVLIAVDRAADDLMHLGLTPDVVVVSSADPGTVPSLDALRAARDVVVRSEQGERPGMLASLGDLGAHPARCETTLSTEDIALLLAAEGRPEIVVGVGVHAELTELLDHRRAALAGTYLTRLRLGSLLVDASSVSRLYSGRTRTWHVLLVVLAGWLALAVALAVTPVGHQWFTSLLDTLQGLF